MVFFFPLLLCSFIEQLSEVNAVSGTFLLGQTSFKSSFGLQHLSDQPVIGLAGEQETSDSVRNALCALQGMLAGDLPGNSYQGNFSFISLPFAGIREDPGHHLWFSP